MRSVKSGFFALLGILGLFSTAYGQSAGFNCPAAASYTAVSGDNNKVLCSDNAPGGSISFTLPNPATVGAGWLVGFSEGQAKGINVVLPNSVYILTAQKTLTSFSAPSNSNYEYFSLVSDGTNFRLQTATDATARQNGLAGTNGGRLWTLLFATSYGATQFDNGATLSSSVAGAPVTITLPQTPTIPNAWSISLYASAGNPITLQTNGVSGGTLISPSGNTVSTYTLANNSYAILSFDGAAFRVVLSTSGKVALSCVDYGADPLGIVDSWLPIQTCINAAAGGPVFLSQGNFKSCSALTNFSTFPLDMGGAGRGAGPGTIITTNITQLNACTDSQNIINITSNGSSHIHDIQFNSLIPQVTAGKALNFVGIGTNVVTNPIIERNTFFNVYQPIWIVRPFYPTIENNYFQNWGGVSAVGEVTTTGIEGSGGFIAHNIFWGSIVNGTQTAAIYSEVGYTDIHDNEILAANATIYFHIANFQAGFIKIHDNTIENSLNYGILIDTTDSVNAKASMVMIQNNEFSNVAYLANFVAHITIGEVAVAGVGQNWVQDINISGNTFRSIMPTNGQKYIWAQAGQRIKINGNTIEDLAANNPTGIQITGAVHGEGLLDPIEVLDNTISGTSLLAKYNFASSINVRLRDMTGVTFADLGGTYTNPGNGSQIFITNGTTGSPCTGAGTGTVAFRQNGAWKCF